MTKQTSVPTATTSAGADDLTRIRGIGPAIALRLSTAGVTSYDEIAARSPAELAAIVGVAGLSAEQIVKKNWVGQALGLAAERAPTMADDETFDHQPSAPEAQPATINRQHYATFTVELLLDEENDVRRTRVAHVQGGAEESWAGWRETQFLAFFTQSAQIQTPPAESASLAQEIVPDVAEAGNSAQAQISRLDVMAAGADGSQSFLRDGQPFEVQLELTFSNPATTPDEPLVYGATVYAKNLLDRSRHIVGEVRDTRSRTDLALLRLAGGRLPHGIYRLEAVASIIQPVIETGATDELTAFWEGGLIQVY